MAADRQSIKERRAQFCRYDVE